MPVIYCDTTEANRLIRRMEKATSTERMKVAMSRALNSTLRHIPAETKRQVQREYAVKASLQKGVKKIHASPGNLHAEALYTGATLPLYTFATKAPKNRYRSPVSALVKLSNGWQTHEEANPAMFKAYGRKVLTRAAGQRTIRTAHTISIPQMVSNESVYQEIARDAESYLYERVEYYVGLELDSI